MSLLDWIERLTWSYYSKKLQSRLEKPQSYGVFSEKERLREGVRLAFGKGGNQDIGNLIELHFLVDKEDGVILDARYEALGQTALIGAAEAICEMVLGKNYEQARRITKELVDRHLRDREDAPAFPQGTEAYIDLVLEAVFEAAEMCSDLPIATSYAAPPVPSGKDHGHKTSYPGWPDLPLKRKIAVIEEVLDQDVRPYIALDAGGVVVLDIKDKEVKIAYEGTCTSCYSSVGSTLSYIQQILQDRVHPEIVVIPDLDISQFGH